MMTRLSMFGSGLLTNMQALNSGTVPSEEAVGMDVTALYFLGTHGKSKLCLHPQKSGQSQHCSNHCASHCKRMLLSPCSAEGSANLLQTLNSGTIPPREAVGMDITALRSMFLSVAPLKGSWSMFSYQQWYLGQVWTSPPF